MNCLFKGIILFALHRSKSIVTECKFGLLTPALKQEGLAAEKNDAAER